MAADSFGGGYPPGPPGPGYPPQQQGAYGAPPQPAYGAPPQPGYGAPGYGGPPGYGAPAPQPGYGAPDPYAQQGYGAPPQQPGYGAPPADPYAQQGYGAPPGGAGGQGYAPPQGSFGQQVDQFGQQVGQAFNQAMQDMSGSQAMQPAGYGGAPMGGGPPGMGAPGYGGMGGGGGRGPKGQVRNPVTVMLISMFCGIYQFLWFIWVCNEISSFLQRDEPVWWKVMLFSSLTCGIYGIWWMFAKLGPLVQEVQQRAGVANPTNHGWLYIVPVYNVLLLQQELNRAWETPG